MQIRSLRSANPQVSQPHALRAAKLVTSQPPVFSVTRELWADVFRDAVSWGFAPDAWWRGVVACTCRVRTPGRPRRVPRAGFVFR